jgi:hypothetical protein
MLIILTLPLYNNDVQYSMLLSIVIQHALILIFFSGRNKTQKQTRFSYRKEYASMAMDL